MTSMAKTAVFVTGGVDTHGHTHHAAVLDYMGRQLGDREFPTSPAGYRAPLQWMSGMALLTGSASRAPAPTGSASHATSEKPGCMWWRWTDPTGGPAETKESPIHWMLTPQPGRRYRVVHRSCRRCATAR